MPPAKGKRALAKPGKSRGRRKAENHTQLSGRGRIATPQGQRSLRLIGRRAKSAEKRLDGQSSPSSSQAKTLQSKGANHNSSRTEQAKQPTRTRLVSSAKNPSAGSTPETRGRPREKAEQNDDTEPAAQGQVRNTAKGHFKTKPERKAGAQAKERTKRRRPPKEPVELRTPKQPHDTKPNLATGSRCSVASSELKNLSKKNKKIAPTGTAADSPFCASGEPKQRTREKGESTTKATVEPNPVLLPEKTAKPSESFSIAENTGFPHAYRSRSAPPDVEKKYPDDVPHTYQGHVDCESPVSWKAFGFDENLAASADQITRDPFGQCESSTEDSSESYEDPQDAFYRGIGYLPPLDEDTERLIKLIMKGTKKSKAFDRPQAGSDAFETALTERNVRMDPEVGEDDYVKEIDSLETEDFMKETHSEAELQDSLWRNDQLWLKATSNEAVFQRTMMMGLFARNALIYKTKNTDCQVFDFNNEESWTCPPMPSKKLNNVNHVRSEDARVLTQPKPDLTIAFNRDAVMTRFQWNALPAPLKPIATFEKPRANTKAFHFLTVEAKNAETQPTDTRGLHQSLNCASQALFNLYELFRAADRPQRVVRKEQNGSTAEKGMGVEIEARDPSKHRDNFFKTVRVFTVVTSKAGLLVRIHRAKEIRLAGSFDWVNPSDATYPLEYTFENFARLEGNNQFSRRNVLAILRKILKYAKDTLGASIKDAVSDIIAQSADAAYHKSRSSWNFYRHGQPWITEAAASEIGTTNGGYSHAPTIVSQSTVLPELAHTGLMSVTGGPPGPSPATHCEAMDVQTMGRQQNDAKIMLSPPGSEGGKRRRGQERTQDQFGTASFIPWVPAEDDRVAKRQRGDEST